MKKRWWKSKRTQVAKCNETLKPKIYLTLCDIWSERHRCLSNGYCYGEECCYSTRDCHCRRIVEVIRDSKQANDWQQHDARRSRRNSCWTNPMRFCRVLQTWGCCWVTWQSIDCHDYSCHSCCYSLTPLGYYFFCCWGVCWVPEQRQMMNTYYDSSTKGCTSPWILVFDCSQS